MPVLSSDGGHKLSMTDRINTRVGSDYWGSHVAHLGGSPPIKNSRGLPLLLGRHWLKTAHIKQNWRKNIITFRRGKTKVRVPTQPHSIAGKEMTPLYAEGINMLEGLADEEVNQYLQEKPKIVAEAVSSYILQPEENNECYPVLWANTFDSPTGIGIKERGA